LNDGHRCDFVVVQQSTLAGKKRKSNVGSVKLAQSQARNTYIQATCTRSNCLGGIEEKKLRTGLSTSPSVGWELKSNPKVIAKGKVFKCQDNKKVCVSDKRQLQKYSKAFDRQIDAEKHLFEFRISLESKSSQKKIEALLIDDDWKEEEEKVFATKKPRFSTVSKATPKSQSLSSSNCIRQRGLHDLNPNNSMSIERASNSDGLSHPGSSTKKRRKKSRGSTRDTDARSGLSSYLKE
jgi:hypothetical protein